MELFFSLRPEGRENKLPFSLLANRERKDLLKVIAACAETFSCLHSSVIAFIYISITSASLWENVSLSVWACAHWGCHRGSWYRHHGGQHLQGSADKLGLLYRINMHEDRHPGASWPINMCHFKFSHRCPLWSFKPPIAETKAAADLPDPACHFHFSLGFMTSACLL